MTQLLLMEERMVLNLVQEYIEDHQLFNVNAIIPFISSRFAKSSINISNEGIKSILQSLVRKNFIIEGSSLTREDVLNNENRKLIYEYILRNPGDYFYKIVKKTKLNIPVVEWHLKMLLKFNFIKKRKIGNQEIYFKAGKEHEVDEIIYFIKKDISKKIINYFLNDNAGLTKTQSVKQLKIHYNTISKYFNKLERMKILNTIKLSNMTIFFLNKELWIEKYAQYCK